jgi:hypothetical protein
MENKIKSGTERWVEERMALLAAPDVWEPDLDKARRRLRGCLSASRPILARSWLPRMATVALVCLVLLFTIPTTRALTVQLWRWLTMQKVEVVQADFQKLHGIWLVPQMEEIEMEEDLPAPPPSLDLMEAASRAGFTPRLPREGVPPVAPDLTVFDSEVWGITLNTADMEASLRQAGVDDQPIPKEWNGARLSFQAGSGIGASWPGDEDEGMGLVQHLPITLSAPADFDITAYWTAALRAAGVNREQAQQFAERMRRAPTLLFGIVSKYKMVIREVNLRSGPATLIENISETGKVNHVLLIWSVADRVYHLNAKSEEQAIVVANSIE